MQLAWIFTYGPAELRNLEEARWWLALAQARWSDRQDDVELPTHSVGELRECLMESMSEKHRNRLQESARAYAYAEFVRNR